MTKWERVYRAMGGKGPGDYPDRADRWEHRVHLASQVGLLLISLGFLARDPSIQPEIEQTWFTNYRWQWKFWRGAYCDLLLQKKREGKAWAQFWVEPTFCDWLVGL